jgi:hypothetical protein
MHDTVSQNKEKEKLTAYASCALREVPNIVISRLRHLSNGARRLHVKYQRPRDPDRLKNHLKRKGIDLVEHDKENTPAEAPPPVTDGKPPNHSPMKGKNVF